MVTVVFPHDESRQAAISFYISNKAKCVFLLYESYNFFLCVVFTCFDILK